ncbi:hypothetical protein REPUB_Repub08aG0102200 [Reevesia pubescens]
MVVLKLMSVEELKKYCKEKPKVVEPSKTGLIMLSKKKFEAESKETGLVYAVISKETTQPALQMPPQVLREVKELLGDFSDIIPKELSNELLQCVIYRMQ